MTAPRRFSAPALLLAASALVAACSGGSATNDSAAAGIAGATTAAASDDSGTMAGMSHDSMGAMAGMNHANRAPAKDADHEFLRTMSDHHKGLVEMAMPAMNKATSATAKADAHALHTKQEAEMKKMVDTVRVAYGETVQPMAMPMHKAQNDSLQAMSGAAYDRAFYRMVVQHHREGVKMLDQFEPRVQRPSTKQMIAKMRTEHQREIQEFERKMVAISGA